MKIKILALIMAVFCLSTVLVGCAQPDKACDKHVDENQDGICDNEKCDFKFCSVHKDNDANLVCDDCGLTLTKCDAHKDEVVDNVCDVCKLPIPVKCDVHKDENADKTCDACGGAIVIITEQLAPSTDAKVDMVVNSIPENVNLGDYIVVDKEDVVITELEKLDLNAILDHNDMAWLQLTYDDVNDVNTYEVYDYINNKSIFKVDDSTATSDTYKNVSITLSDYYFVVTVNEYDRYSYVPRKASIAYYDYTGKNALAGANWEAYVSEQTWDQITNELVPTIYDRNSITYVTFGSDVYAFDSVTSELLGKFNDKELVYRPEFDKVRGDKYGYVEQDNKIFVYDLNKWIECVYVYEIPVNYVTFDWFVLENGNVLVQGIEAVSAKNVNYDYMENDAKFDMVYTVIDPSAKNEKNVEFGYKIMAVQAAANESFTDKAQNLAAIMPIVGDSVSADYKIVILNNDLTIAADITEAIRLQLVADELFAKTENVGGVEKTTIVDINGNEVVYVPYTAIINDKFISYDGKIYSFKMKELMDLADEGFQIYFDCDSYMILTKYDTENYRYVYYYYDMQSESAKKIPGQDNGLFNVAVYDFGYVVSYTDMGQNVYKFYNTNGESVGTLDSEIAVIEYFEDFIVLQCYNGYYIVK